MKSSAKRPPLDTITVIDYIEALTHRATRQRPEDAANCGGAYQRR